jgi:hypothetical protein
MNGKKWIENTFLAVIPPKISTGYKAISLKNLVRYVFTIRLVFSCGIIEPEQYTLHGQTRNPSSRYFTREKTSYCLTMINYNQII